MGPELRTALRTDTAKSAGLWVSPATNQLRNGREVASSLLASPSPWVKWG